MRQIRGEAAEEQQRSPDSPARVEKHRQISAHGLSTNPHTPPLNRVSEDKHQGTHRRVREQTWRVGEQTGRGREQTRRVREHTGGLGNTQEGFGTNQEG